MWVCEKCNQATPGPICMACGHQAVATTAHDARRQRLIGAVVNGMYRLDEVVGTGGMGTLYRAVQLNTGDPVALKLLTCPEGTNTTDAAGLVRRFRREAQVLSRLHHANTVRVVDFGEMDTERFYLVMELLKGCNLASEIERCGCLPPARSAGIARQVCASLSEAHRLDIVHRDLKPSNVFLAVRPDGGEVVKVLDFGIAKVLNVDTAVLTYTGDFLGTPHYMAPEQICGDSVGPYTDLYALGAMLFRMLTGSYLFAAESGSLVAHHHLHTPPPTLVLPGQPRALVDRWQALLERLLAKSASDRPAAADEVAAELATLAQLGEQNGLETVPKMNPSAWPAAATAVSDSDPTRVTNDQITPLRPPLDD